MLLLLLFSIVIESLLFPVLIICVVWLVSIIQQKKGWYSWLYSPAGTVKTNQNYFFCSNNIILTPPLHTEIVVQFYPYHTQKPTYLSRNQPRLFWRLFIFNFPLSPTVNSPNNPTTGRRNILSKQHPRNALCCYLVFI